MAYEIIDHGEWETYEPEAPLPGKFATIPLDGAVFFRRKSDGVDWYVFANTPSNFTRGAVFATCLPSDRGYIVQAVQRDPTRILPGISRVIEILGVSPKNAKPHRLFEQQRYDPKAGTIEPFPPK